MKDVLSTDIKSSSLRQLPLKLPLMSITSNYDKRQKNLKAEQIDLTDDSCGLLSNSTDKVSS